MQTYCESWCRRFWFPTYAAVFVHLPKIPWPLPVAEKLSQAGYQLSIGSAKCSGIHSEYIFAFYVGKKKKSINSHFYAVFCTLVVFENVLIFGNNQNKTTASLYPPGVCEWWHSPGRLLVTASVPHTDNPLHEEESPVLGCLYVAVLLGGSLRLLNTTWFYPTAPLLSSSR